MTVCLANNGTLLWGRRDYEFDSDTLHWPGELNSVIQTRSGKVIAVGTSLLINQQNLTDAMFVRLAEFQPAPQFIAWSPEDTTLTVLLDDTILFKVRTNDQRGLNISHQWFYNDERLDNDTTQLVIFDELGAQIVQCSASNGQYEAVRRWNVMVNDFIIRSHTPEDLFLNLRRNTQVDFALHIGYVNDGQRRPSYTWTLIDRIDQNRRAEIGLDSTASIFFSSVGRYAVEGLAVLDGARDSITWEITVHGLIRAYWPTDDIISLQPGRRITFGVAPFNRGPASRQFYRWTENSEELAYDSAEFTTSFPNLGHYILTVFVTDSVQIDSLYWEFAAIDSQRWTVNVSTPDWMDNSKFQIPNSKFQIRDCAESVQLNDSGEV